MRRARMAAGTRLRGRTVSRRISSTFWRCWGCPTAGLAPAWPKKVPEPRERKEQWE